jgi:Zn-dependent hydrolases, including glyoxylases
LVDGGTELTLIDAGYGGTVSQMLRNIESWGLDPGKLRRCLLTHAHHDHARGAAVWQELGLEIVASAQTARDIAAPGLGALAYSCPDGEFAPCVVDRVVGDDENIKAGAYEFTSVHVPGHSGGDVAYTLRLLDGRTVFFVGDIVQCDGVTTDLGYPHSADRNELSQLRSLYRLFQMRPDVLLPAHGMLALANGYRWLGQALHATSKRGMLE